MVTVGANCSARKLPSSNFPLSLVFAPRFEGYEPSSRTCRFGVENLTEHLGCFGEQLGGGFAGCVAIVKASRSAVSARSEHQELARAWHGSQDIRSAPFATVGHVINLAARNEGAHFHWRAASGAVRCMGLKARLGLL